MGIPSYPAEAVLTLCKSPRQTPDGERLVLHKQELSKLLNLQEDKSRCSKALVLPALRHQAPDCSNPWQFQYRGFPGQQANGRHRGEENVSRLVFFGFGLGFSGWF